MNFPNELGELVDGIAGNVKGGGEAIVNIAVDIAVTTMSEAEVKDGLGRLMALHPDRPKYKAALDALK